MDLHALYPGSDGGIRNVEVIPPWHVSLVTLFEAARRPSARRRGRLSDSRRARVAFPPVIGDETGAVEREPGQAGPIRLRRVEDEDTEDLAGLTARDLPVHLMPARFLGRLCFRPGRERWVPNNAAPRLHSAHIEIACSAGVSPECARTTGTPASAAATSRIVQREVSRRSRSRSHIRAGGG